ncbi:hypothetical protein CEXT_738261 [Caerostris extrusa]|uniref:Sushi domain-containing protein n=1 Tax=Caerostris extrusa TaxID=172846 RepID=A0AAV4NFW7_CAEEX|nr:hypothetical protein CEXT_738261 [Caerostris extrusa]
MLAVRTCGENGMWIGNITNFTQCVSNIQELYPNSWAPTIVALIVVIGSTLSIIALSLSLFIFFYFKQRQLYESTSLGYYRPPSPKVHGTSDRHHYTIPEQYFPYSKIKVELPQKTVRIQMGPTGPKYQNKIA